MIVEVDADESHQQEGGRHQRAEQMHRLPDQRRARHLGRRDAVRLPRFRENGQHAEIERVVGNEERERNTQHAGHDREIRAEHGRHELNHAIGHGVDHLRARQNAGEDASGEDEPDHGQHVAGMARQQGLLLVDGRVIQQHGHGEADHEQHRQRQHGGDQRHQQRHGEHRVHDQAIGAPMQRVVADIRIGELLEQHLCIRRR